MKGFIEFMRKGNLVQVAVAFVMGLAFAAVVTSFVNDLISPLLGLFGGVDFSSKTACLTDTCDATEGVLLSWGAFLTAVITFVTTALVLYFLVVKPYERIEERFAKEDETDPGPSEVELLVEIRDALVGQGGTPHAGADVRTPNPPA